MSDIPERDIVLAYLAETNDPAFFMDGRTRALIRVAYDAGVASQQAEIDRLQKALQVCEMVVHRVEPTDAMYHAVWPSAAA